MLAGLYCVKPGNFPSQKKIHGGDSGFLQVVERFFIFPQHRGVSLTELLVVLAVVGIIATIAIPQIASMRGGAEQTVAMENLERLNRALHNHNQAWREISIAPVDASFVDEILVLQELRTVRMLGDGLQVPGSPFIDPNVDFQGSASTGTYRGSWDGIHFVLIPPGTSGAGLDLIPSITPVE